MYLPLRLGDDDVAEGGDAFLVGSDDVGRGIVCVCVCVESCAVDERNRLLGTVFAVVAGRSGI